jgi:type IV secretory pathway VirJ component
MTRRLLLIPFLGLAMVPQAFARADDRTGEARFVEETVRIPLLGQVAAVRPRETSKIHGVVLFVSGDGGWKLGVVGMARRLGAEALVVGIPMPDWQRIAEKHAGACWYPAGELEAMAQAVEKIYKFPRYLPPVLVGYSSGATVVYGALAQAPAGSFAGGVSLGFCPDLEVRRPICSKGDWHPSFDPKKGKSLLPARPDLPARADGSASWIALQGMVDQVCDFKAVERFAANLPAARVILLPKVGHGFGVTRNWGDAFDGAVGSFLEPDSAWAAPREAETPSAPNQAPEAIRHKLEALGLPLVVSWPRQTELILIFLSGDGGWMELDREVAARLHRASVAVVGWNTLRYFWAARSPEEFDADLARVIEALPDSLPVFAGGFSFGAEVVPVSLDRQAARSSPAAHLRGLVLLAPGPFATFEVSPLDWVFENDASTRFPVAAAVAHELHLPILCLEPSSGEKSGCPSKPQANLRHFRLAGSHHFGGDYSTLVEDILSFMRQTVSRGR